MARFRVQDDGRNDMHEEDIQPFPLRSTRLTRLGDARVLPHASATKVVATPAWSAESRCHGCQLRVMSRRSGGVVGEMGGVVAFTHSIVGPHSAPAHCVESLL